MAHRNNSPEDDSRNERYFSTEAKGADSFEFPEQDNYELFDHLLQRLQDSHLDGVERRIAGERLVDLAQKIATSDPEALLFAHESFARTLFEIDESTAAIEQYTAALSILDREHSKESESLISNSGFARIELLYQLSECYDQANLMEAAFQTWKEIAVSLPGVVRQIVGCGRRVSAAAEGRLFASASIAEYVTTMVLRISEDRPSQQPKEALSLVRDAVIQSFFPPTTDTSMSAGELLASIPTARQTPALAPVLGVLANCESEGGDSKIIEALLSARWELYAKYAEGVGAKESWSTEHPSNYLLPEALEAGIDLARQDFGNGRMAHTQDCLLSLFNFAQFGASHVRISLVNLAISFVGYADFDDAVPIVDCLRARKDLFYSSSQRLRFLAEAGNKYRRAKDRDGASSLFQEGAELIANQPHCLETSALASFYFYRAHHTLFSRGPPSPRLLASMSVRVDLRRVVELTSDNSVDFNGRLYFLIRACPKMC